MKFLVPNYSCLQNPWLGNYRPQIPVPSLSSTEFVEPPPEQNSWVRHWLSCTEWAKSNCAHVDDEYVQRDRYFSYVTYNQCRKWIQFTEWGGIYIYIYIHTHLAVLDSVFPLYFGIVFPRCKFYLRGVFEHSQSLHFVYSQPPIKQHCQFAPIKIFEQKFSVIQYFDLPSPSINRHELRWKSSGALSWLDSFIHSFIHSFISTQP